MIEAIEAELAVEFLPGAYAWMDKHKDNAFTKAVNRFEEAILFFRSNGALDLYNQETDVYKNTIVGLLREYKREKKMNESDEFLRSIRGQSAALA